MDTEQLQKDIEGLKSSYNNIINSIKSHDHDGINSTYLVELLKTNQNFEMSGIKTLAAGGGSSCFKLDTQSVTGLTSGIWMGAETFANAPFSVDMKGNVKATSVILTGSITTGDLKRNDFHFATYFESIDGYDLSLGGGSIAIDGTAVTITTDVHNTDYTTMTKRVISDGGLFSWDKKRSFKTCVVFDGTDDQAIYIGVGSVGSGDTDQICFYLSDTTLYGRVKKAGQIEGAVVAATGITVSTKYTLEARFYPAEKVEFYVDGVLAGTYSTVARIPTGDAFADVLFNINVETQENAAKVLKLGYWDFWQSTS